MTGGTEPRQPDAARLSRLLFDAREQADMLGDIMLARQGPDAARHPYTIRDLIDAYRAEQGWSPNGFGGER